MTDVDSALLPIPQPEWRASLSGDGAAVDVLILSKDRACQLDGLLRTMRAFLTIPHRKYVLYKTSNLAFERGYDMLRRWNPEVEFIDEAQTFRQCYLDLVARIAAGPGRYWMPVMDDMIFTRTFTAQPLIDLLDTDEDVLAISLRLGENITYCYTRNAPTTPPDFSNGHRWEWRTASPGYWNYPMSVDANIYRTAEMAEYIPTLQFGKAEVIEARMAGVPLNRPHMLCEPTPSVLNLAINRVQHTFKNRHGTITPEALNGAFLAGFAMDVRPLLGRTFNACHVEVELSLVPDARERPGATPLSSTGWKPQRNGAVVVTESHAVVTLKRNGTKLKLNQSAEEIWKLCDGTRTPEDIQNELAQHFDATPRQLHSGVRSALANFINHGLLRQERPEGAYRRIDLRQIPCFVINCEADAEKDTLMKRQLAELGIPYERVPGIAASPDWVGVALSHLKVLRLTRSTTPFLVLEDDCLFNDRFQPVWQVPVEADALYLGVSEFGLETPGHFSWGRRRKNQWRPYDRSFLRIFNMLARHAVVYLSNDYCEQVIQSQIEALTNRSLPYPGDIGCAMLQASHVVLTPNEPICRQTGRDSTVRPLPEL